MSRTYQYRKVMKPMLERKRRARINKCLDELKDLMVSALASDGENVTKLEKADVLELTVRHLRRLKQNRLLGVLSPRVMHDRYMSGFAHCAAQVGSYLATCPRTDGDLSARLMAHMSQYMQSLDSMAAVELGPGSTTADSPRSATSVVTVNTAHSGGLLSPPLTPPTHQSVLGTLTATSIERVASPGSDLYPASDSEVCSWGPSDLSEGSRSRSVSRSEDDKVWRPW